MAYESDEVQKLAVNYFADALDDSSMRLEIFKAHPRSLDDAVVIAANLESFTKMENMRRPVMGRRFVREIYDHQRDEEVMMLRESLNQMQSQMNSLMQEFGAARSSGSSSQQRRGNAVCFVCGDLDHFKVDCPKRSRPHRSENGSGSAYRANNRS